jgi:hypothetical protein
MAQLLMGSPPMAWKIQGTKSPEPMVLTIMSRGVPAKCPLHSHSGDLAPVNPRGAQNSKLKLPSLSWERNPPFFMLRSWIVLIFC